MQQESLIIRRFGPIEEVEFPEIKRVNIFKCKMATAILPTEVTFVPAWLTVTSVYFTGLPGWGD